MCEGLSALSGIFDMFDAHGGFAWKMGVKKPVDGWLDVNPPDGETLLTKKRELLETNREQVFAVLDGIEEPSQEILDAVIAHLQENGVGCDSQPVDVHPLEAAALLTVEDLVVMVERDNRLIFGGGVVCFPNRWDLPSKLGKTMAEVHAPVPQLNTQLGQRIDGFLRNLEVGRVFSRRGWGVIDTPELFQPVNPKNKKVDSSSPEKLFLRVEQETLRRFESQNAILFTIRTRMYSLAEVLADPVLREDLRAIVDILPNDVADYKNMTGLAFKPIG